jgi:hypothetical protein
MPPLLRPLDHDNDVAGRLVKTAKSAVANWVGVNDTVFSATESAPTGGSACRSVTVEDRQRPAKARAGQRSRVGRATAPLAGACGHGSEDAQPQAPLLAAICGEAMRPALPAAIAERDR